jgi:hypothetical protein
MYFIEKTGVMLSITRALKDNSLLKGGTGLEVCQFKELVPKFGEGLKAADQLCKPNRIRKAGACSKHKLEDDASKLFLSYFTCGSIPDNG